MLKRVKGFTLIELLIVVAIIAILAAIAVPNFLEAQTRSKVSKAKADMRTYATALETYYIDNNSYPAQCSGTEAGMSNVNTNVVGIQANGLGLPSFRVRGAAGSGTEGFSTLTTPVAYMTTMSFDPFADQKGTVFSYSISSASLNNGWLMWSFGPDVDQNVIHTVPAAAPGFAPGAAAYWTAKGFAAPNPLTHNYGGDISLTNNSTAVFKGIYGPEVEFLNPALSDISYDPTNGTSSQGDVYRQKE